jgi:hypothetical protein
MMWSTDRALTLANPLPRYAVRLSITRRRIADLASKVQRRAIADRARGPVSGVRHSASPAFCRNF